MPVKHSPRTTPSPNRTTQTQGIALVVVLLSAMVLMVSLLAITSTMVISSQRTTADQGATLQAQYAAEAGLARASANSNEAQAVMGQMLIPSNQNASNIRTYIQNLCGRSIPATPTVGSLCNATDLAHSGSNKFSLFTAYVPSSAYPSGAPSANLYWQEVFPNTSTSSETRIAADTSAGTESWYRVSYGLKLESVTFQGPDYYRIFFSVRSTTSDGEMRAGNRILAARKIRQDAFSQNTVIQSYIDVSRPPFSKNFVFRNKTTSSSGSQLYFAGGETFNGPVHTNDTPGFYKIGGQTPVFTDTFTSCADSGVYAGYSSNSSTRAAEEAATFRGSPPKRFGGDGVECVGLPPNSNNQLRAAFGGDATDESSVTDAQLKTAWGVNNFTNGVYFSKGNGSTANIQNNWNSNTSGSAEGGVYVRGDVDELKFSTLADSRQVIEIKQATKITKFEQLADGKWKVTPPAPTPSKTLTGSFNGIIYVDGAVKDLRGNGTNSADIASGSQITLASTKDVAIKQDITYEDDPNSGENVRNILGIYSNGGSVLADGPSNKDLNIHASIMASKGGEGFGTANFSDPRGSVDGRKARINLLGGVIEDQSQTVGDVGSGGYTRNYSYDKRFKDGLTPPFFPTQKYWTAAPQFTRPQQVWQTVGN